MQQPHEPPVAVITGASRGLGLAMSLELADAGYALVLAARNREMLEAAGERAAAIGANVLTITTDVTAPDQVERLGQGVRERFGTIDVLVNNAGIMGGEYGIEAIEPAEWNAVLATSLTGAYLCSRALLPVLRSPGGAIINISSGAAVRTGFLNVAYGVAKAGLDRLTLGLHAELEPRGIACVSLSPPTSATDAVRALSPGRDVDDWAQPPEITGHALRRLLESGPQAHSGRVVTVRELIR